jgi:hypothetical protein
LSTRAAGLLAALATTALLAAPVATVQAQVALAKPVGFGPLSDGNAAAQVKRSRWEPRPANAVANRRVPGAALLRKWRRRSEMPYAGRVTGRFRGTTDEIIQWAARKWGFAPNLLRAVAVVESWWRQDAIGDGGDSFGLFQVRRPYHCWGRCRIARRFTAFNADYYGGILRAYLDGTQRWLNTVERGRPYRAGDVWGSVGAWYSGRWWTPESVAYMERVREELRRRTWRRDFF